MTPQDNELMCRVEGNAPMGRMLVDNFWFPVALSNQLEADGAPMRVKLVGKSFVAFRSTDGRVGLFDERCPHRGASLALARNEDNALRCIFHGWKFGVDGEVKEVPTEPHNETKFCKAVPLARYPVREAGGIMWAWLGAAKPAAFPDFEFNNLPDDQVFVVRQDCRYNWVQDVEGGMDSAHIGVLHSGWIGGLGAVGVATKNTAPVYEFQDRPNGFRYAAIRKYDDGTSYVRVNEYVAPWYSFICPEEVPDGDRVTLMSTPVDDENCVHWMIRYNPFAAIKASYVTTDTPNSYPPQPPGGPDTVWGQDRASMKSTSFTGFHHVITEDFVVAESQGRIADRSKEFMNAGDRAVVRVRQILLQAVKNSVEGDTPIRPSEDGIAYSQVRATGSISNEPFDWDKVADVASPIANDNLVNHSLAQAER